MSEAAAAADIKPGICVVLLTVKPQIIDLYGDFKSLSPDQSTEQVSDNTGKTFEMLAYSG